MNRHFTSPEPAPSPEPFFSVIVNVFNGARFLQGALDSVMAQTYPEWELILWDDHSDDESPAIIGRCSAPLIRRHISPVRLGLVEARNLAMGVARGDWLAFLDQDDIWSPTKLARQRALIEADRDGTLGIVYGRTMKFNQRGRQWDADRWHEFTRLPDGNIFRELIVHSCFPAMSSVALRRQFVCDLGQVPSEYRFCPDYYMLLAISRLYQAACLQDVCCWYRIHERNLSKTNTMDIHQEILRIVELWANQVEPTLYDRRRRIHQSLIGLEEMFVTGRVRAGIARILRLGSLDYLCSRPFVKASRGIRRTWRRLGKERQPMPPWH